MTLAKAKAQANAKVKHIYGTGIIYDHHLRLSKYFYNTGHRSQPCGENLEQISISWNFISWKGDS